MHTGPGLNDVIAELFNTLYYNYGVSRIHGIRSGFRGFWSVAAGAEHRTFRCVSDAFQSDFYFSLLTNALSAMPLTRRSVCRDPRFFPWIDLTPEGIRGIDSVGGTVLGSSRGGFNIDAIMQACMNRGVNQLYIIGGDGTHRAADIIQHEARKRSQLGVEQNGAAPGVGVRDPGCMSTPHALCVLSSFFAVVAHPLTCLCSSSFRAPLCPEMKMTVACVPKTIDNDIGVIDRSFGFNTAVAQARQAIQSAVVESSCAPNGLGIVQLMGRHAGYISAHATLASRQVDMCLIPEVPFPMEGPHGVLALTEAILQRQGYGVIVVAEGAGADLLPTIGYDGQNPHSTQRHARASRPACRRARHAQLQLPLPARLVSAASHLALSRSLSLSPSPPLSLSRSERQQEAPRDRQVPAVGDPGPFCPQENGREHQVSRPQVRGLNMLSSFPRCVPCAPAGPPQPACTHARAHARRWLHVCQNFICSHGSDCCSRVLVFSAPPPPLSYMIRSVPADASDSVYCMTLAQNAVHGAMCGFTGFTSGLVNNRTVLLPIPVITATSPSYLNPAGRTWERVLSLTHQPSTTWVSFRSAQRKCRKRERGTTPVANSDSCCR
jgi:6-phosphofructokinase